MFRKFLIESVDRKWFNKFPMPESVSSFLIASVNLSQSEGADGIRESMWDDSQGRGYPLNQGAVDFLAISPKSATTMTDAFIWLVTEGTYQATRIRKKLAEEFTAQTGKEITEDVIYAPAAWKNIDGLYEFLQSKYQEDANAFEPKNPIEFNVNKKLISFTLQEANNLIREINEQVKKTSKEQVPSLLKEFHFGPRLDLYQTSSGYEQEDHAGFIEWVENGSWAEKTFGSEKEGEPWRTRHGISLHNSKKYKQTSEKDQGMVHYEFGDGNIIMPMREFKHIRHLLAKYPKRLVAKTFENINQKIDDIRDPAIRERIMDISNAALKGKYNHKVTHANSRGVDQSYNFDSFESIPEYLANMFLIKLAVDMRTTAHDAVLRSGKTDKKDIEDVINKALKDQYPNSKVQLPGKTAYRFFRKAKADGEGEGESYFDQDNPNAKSSDELFQIGKNHIAKGIEALKSGEHHYKVPKRNLVPMTASFYSDGKKIIQNMSSEDIRKKMHQFFSGISGLEKEDLEEAVKEAEEIARTADKITLPAAITPASAKLGQIFDKKLEIDKDTLDKLTGPETFEIIKGDDGLYYVIDHTDENPDDEPNFTGQYGKDPSKLLTPEQKAANQKSGWKIVGGEDALLNSTRAVLAKQGQRIKLTRDKLKDNWSFYDQTKPKDHSYGKESIPIMSTDNSVRFGTSRKKGVSNNVKVEKLNQVEEKIHQNPKDYGYENIGEFEKDIADLAKIGAKRNYSYNSNEKVGYNTAYPWMYESMLMWMGSVPEFVRRFGDINQEKYWFDILKIAKDENININQSMIKQARQTGDYSRIPEPVFNLMIKMGREYRRKKALEGFNKIVNSQSVQGARTTTNDEGEAQAVDFSSGQGKRHSNERDFDGRGNRGYSNVADSFGDQEVDDDSKIDLSSKGNIPNIKVISNLRDDKDQNYETLYNRQWRNLSEDPEEIHWNMKKFRIKDESDKPKLDAIADKLLSYVNYQSDNLETARKLYDKFYKSVAQKYNTVGETLDDNKLLPILFGNDIAKELKSIQTAQSDSEYKKGYNSITFQPRHISINDITTEIKNLPMDTSQETLGKMKAISNGIKMFLAKSKPKNVNDENFPKAVDAMKLALDLNNRHQNIVEIGSLLKILGDMGLFVHRKAVQDFKASQGSGISMPIRTAARQAQNQEAPQTTSQNLSPTPATQPPQSQGGSLSARINRGPLSGRINRGPLSGRISGGDKKEYYSFRTRYLQKLAEMASTGAVYDPRRKPSRDIEGNWKGAVGNPLGVSIKGSVEDRQSNPDGTKDLKRARRKKRNA